MITNSLHYVTLTSLSVALLSPPLSSPHSCGGCKRHGLGVKELLKAYWVCFHAYCVTAVWLNGKPRGCRGYIPCHLWPVPHLTACVFVLVVLKEQLQLSILRLSTPPLNTHRQSAHTRCLHANTKTCMDVLRTNIYTQTDTSRSRGRTALQTLWLSALDGRLWSFYVVLY